LLMSSHFTPFGKLPDEKKVFNLYLVLCRIESLRVRIALGGVAPCAAGPALLGSPVPVQ